MTNTIRDTEGSETVFTPTVLVAEPGKELRWIGRISPGLIFDGEHSFTLTPLPDGTTRLIHAERFSGVLVPPMQGWLDSGTAPQFEAMNEALAKRVAELR